MHRRLLALFAVAAIGLGGLSIASPATADDLTSAPDPGVNEEIPDQGATVDPVPGATDDPVPGATVDPDTGASDDSAATDATTEETPVPNALAQQTRDELTRNDIIAFGTNAAGTPVVVIETTDDEIIAEAESNPEAFSEIPELLGLDETPEITILSSGIEAIASDDVVDVVGGAGYMTLGDDDAFKSSCSLGFSAWSPTREPAFITAGHCALDDVETGRVVLSIPGEDPAAGGPGGDFDEDHGRLGNFGFTQFGGPDGTPGQGGSPTSIDIAVIDVATTSEEWNLLPQVTDWTTAGPTLGSLSESTTLVKTVGEPTLGAISESGRTSGLTSGEIKDNDILDGWANISGKWVRGFSSNVKAIPGDSGGAVIQGTTAVGVASGSNVNPGPGEDWWMWASSLTHTLPFTGGYEVALDIDEPTITSPTAGSHVKPGSTITGTAPTNAISVEMRVDGGAPETVPVSDGTFQTAASPTPGSHEYTITAINGMSRSGPVAQVVIADLIAPEVFDINDLYPSPTLTGTGFPGATINVNINGAPVGTATVDIDGNWSFATTLDYGTHKVSVTQTSHGTESPAGVGTVTISPVEPEFTSLQDGDSFAADKAPREISGTGIIGATVNVVVGGNTYSTVVGDTPVASGLGAAQAVGPGVEGSWSIDLGARLSSQTHNIAASQSVNEMRSGEARLSVTVHAPKTVVVPPAKPVSAKLATTGGGSLIPIGIAALAMVLVGGAVTVTRARRGKAPKA